MCIRDSSQSLVQLKNKISDHPSKLRLVINATGRLHSETLKPEKGLQQLDKNNMMESFSINAFSPILLAKAIEEFIPKDSDFNFFWELDIENSQSLLQLKNKISDHPSKLRLVINATGSCLLYTSPSPRDGLLSRMPSSA